MKKKKKKRPSSKKTPQQLPKDWESIESDHMIDDHGNIIIGTRNKDPKNLDQDKK